MSHDSTNKNPPSESTSSTTDGGDGNEMDMKDAFQGETYEQKEPRNIPPSNNPNTTQETHKKPDIIFPLINIEHPTAENISNVEKDLSKISTTKPTHSTNNNLSQEEMA